MKMKLTSDELAKKRSSFPLVGLKEEIMNIDFTQSVLAKTKLGFYCGLSHAFHGIMNRLVRTQACQNTSKGMRSGMSYLANRYVNANNKYMKNYDKKTSKYIMYLDANNLYGCAMSQYLPSGGFK